MQNKFGLTQADIKKIVSIIGKYTSVQKAYIFGSRAKGNYKNGSDVDIALKGKEVNFSEISKISYDLNEETNMPYKFDVLNYHSVNEPALTEHIDRVGICFYENKSS